MDQHPHTSTDTTSNSIMHPHHNQAVMLSQPVLISILWHVLISILIRLIKLLDWIQLFHRIHLMLVHRRWFEVVVLDQLHVMIELCPVLMRRLLLHAQHDVILGVLQGHPRGCKHHIQYWHAIFSGEYDSSMFQVLSPQCCDKLWDSWGHSGTGIQPPSSWTLEYCFVSKLNSKM